MRRIKFFISLALLTLTLLALPAHGWALPPTITINSPSGDVFAQDDPYAVASYSCEVDLPDEISSCDGDALDGGMLDTSSPGSYTFWVYATTSEGDSNSASADYSVAGPPSISFLTPSEGEVFTVGEGVMADYSCEADPLTSIYTCEDDGFSTDTAGSFSTTVTAIDALGQTTSETHSYEVAGPPSVTLNYPAEGDVFAVGESITPDYSCDADSLAMPVACEDTGIDTSTPGDFSFTVTATDQLGQSASVSINYTVAAPPSVDLTTPAADAIYKQDEVVSADFSCTADPATSIASCDGSADDGSQLETSSPGNYSFTVVATDALGQTADVTHNYTVAAKPQGTILSPPDGAVYLIGQQVNADYGCSTDPVTTIDTCTGDVDDGTAIDTASAGAKTFSVTATDMLGQSEVASHSFTVLASADPPSVNFTTPPPANAVYTVGQVVNANYSCSSDPQTTVASCVGSVASGSPLETSSAGTKTVSVTVTDGFGQIETYVRSYVVAAKPTITLATPADGAVYALDQAVNANYSCGVDAATTLSSCVGSVANGGVIDTSSAGNGSFSLTATDALGQSTTVTRNYTVAAKPTVNITTPAPDAVYRVGEVVNANYSCDVDAATTLSSCVGDIESGSAIDTSSAGGTTFSVTATDALGQSTTVMRNYKVAAPPSAEITMPADGGVYGVDQLLLANFSCQSDPETTLNHCDGPVFDDDPFDTYAPGAKTFTVTATDALGQQTSVTHNYTVAAKPSAAITTPAEGSVYALNQVVNADYSCDVDAATALSSCVGSVANGGGIDTSSPGNGSFSLTATDALGQSTTVTRNYTVAAKPTVNITTPAPGGVYALDQVVNADYSCGVDPATTLSSCVGSVAIGGAIDTSSAGSKSITVTATDELGQSTTVVRSYTVAAKPTITISSPAENAYYLQGQTATSDYSCNPDPATTIATCSGTVPDGDGFDTSTLGGNSFTVTATDALGQTTTLTHNYTALSSAVRASITFTAPADEAVYALGQVVNADFACSAETPTSVASCVGDVANGAAIDTSSTGAKSVEVTVTDNFGRITTEVHHYTVAEGPTVNITTPPDGATYAVGQTVTADYSCAADAATTLSSCVGTVADGGAIDTGSAGAKTFTVTATDALGQVKTVTRSYTVVAPAPPTTQPEPPTAIELKTRISGKPRLARSGKSVTVRQVCADAGCVVTLTIKLGKKRYRVRSKVLPKSASATPTTVTIKLSSKLTRKIKSAKKKRQKVSIAATIAARP